MIEQCQLGQLYFVTKLKFMASPYEEKPNEIYMCIYLIKVQHSKSEILTSDC